MSHSERSIHEMLKDTPAIHSGTSAIHSGTTDARIRPTNLQVTTSGSSSLPQSTVQSPNYNSPLSPSSLNGDFLKNGASKIDSIKNWSISTYKCTRQIMYNYKKFEIPQIA